MTNVGRPLKFTPERRLAILTDISNAIPYELAAMANGIRWETLYAWIRKGWEDEANEIESEYSLFSQDIKRIERDRIRMHTEKISANVERWQSDAWMLERRWYKYFGSNVHLHELEERMKKVESETTERNSGNGQETENSAA